MSELEKEVQYIKGVGPAKSVLLNKLGIKTLEDLITYYPRGYEDRRKITPICELEDDKEALIKAFVVSRLTEQRIRKNMTVQKLIVRDESGASCLITWFNQSYLKNKFVMGQVYKFYGKVSLKFGKIEMNSPIFDEEGSNKNTEKIVPQYPLTYNLSQNSIRQIIENGLKLVIEKNLLEENMPEYLLKEYGLLARIDAIKKIHFPENFREFEKARKRLVLEELLSMQLALMSLKNKYTKEEPGISYSKDVKMSDVINDLKFKLTKAQLNVLEEIDKDMESSKAMNRLLQGDVGSRKNNSINNSKL